MGLEDQDVCGSYFQNCYLWHLFPTLVSLGWIGEKRRYWWGFETEIRSNKTNYYRTNHKTPSLHNHSHTPATIRNNKKTECKGVRHIKHIAKPATLPTTLCQVSLWQSFWRDRERVGITGGIAMKRTSNHFSPPEPTDPPSKTMDWLSNKNRLSSCGGNRKIY